MAPGKRTTGSGTITRRPNGRYTAQITDERTGRRRSAGTFDTRREAEHAIAEAATTPGPGEAARMPLGDYLAAWAEGHAAYVGAIQADRAGKDIARYVLPYPIARVPLGELAASDFRRHYAMLAARGGKGGRPLGDWSVFGVDKTLRTAIHTALADGDITHDPMPAQRVKVARRERPWTNTENVRRLLALVRLHDPDLEVAVRLGALYGFRRGEISGLRWADVGPDRVRIHATRIVANGRAIDGPPKTPGSAATVLIDEATAAGLDAHRRRRADWIGERLPDDEHVYVTPFGEPLYPDTITERFRRLVVAFNITHDATPLPQGFSFHCLRHSFASNLIAAGESTLVVAAAGRWESAAMVERVYGHLAPSTVADAVARLAAAVGD